MGSTTTAQYLNIKKRDPTAPTPITDTIFFPQPTIVMSAITLKAETTTISASGGTNTVVVPSTFTLTVTQGTSVVTATGQASSSKKSTALGAEIGAGMGVLFVLILALGLFLFRRRQKKAVDEAPANWENTRCELHAESRNSLSMITSGKLLQESVVVEMGGKEKDTLLVDGEPHDVVSTGDANERYELAVHR